MISANIYLTNALLPNVPLGDLSAPFTRTVIEVLLGWPRVEKLVIKIPDLSGLPLWIFFKSVFFYPQDRFRREAAGNQRSKISHTVRQATMNAALSYKKRKIEIEKK